MITAPEVHEAESMARKQRIANARMLRVAASASPDDAKLAQQVITAATADPAAYDRALHNEAVGKLFAKGVLKFGGPE